TGAPIGAPHSRVRLRLSLPVSCLASCCEHLLRQKALVSHLHPGASRVRDIFCVSPPASTFSGPPAAGHLALVFSPPLCRRERRRGGDRTCSIAPSICEDYRAMFDSPAEAHPSGTMGRATARLRRPTPYRQSSSARLPGGERDRVILRAE